MAKTTTKKKASPKSSDAGSKKKKSGGGAKRAPTAYQKFFSEKMQELKESEPDMSGANRREEALRLWAEHKEHHKENE